jgi:hypothetical protein
MSAKEDMMEQKGMHACGVPTRSSIIDGEVLRVDLLALAPTIRSIHAVDLPRDEDHLIHGARRGA